MINIGIIGTGRIANRIINEIKVIEGLTASTVYSHHFEGAKKFAEVHGLAAVDNIDSFFEKVDAVYIATPHETHEKYINEALRRKCHVLCEKPMVLSRESAVRLFDFARKSGLVLMEGIKTAYCPGFLKLISLVNSGTIGEVRNIEATFTKLEKRTNRELVDVMYGGALTELCSYTLFPILFFLGTEPKSVEFRQIKNELGIDIFTITQLDYENAFACSKDGLGVKAEGELIISGTKGYILVEAPWWKTSVINVRYEDYSLNERYEVPYEGEGLRYELQEFVNRIMYSKNEPDIEHISVKIADIIESFLLQRRID